VLTMGAGRGGGISCPLISVKVPGKSSMVVESTFVDASVGSLAGDLSGSSVKTNSNQ
jgi:hypothetical protein